jgi:hypothetical protein
MPLLHKIPPALGVNIGVAVSRLRVGVVGDRMTPALEAAIRVGVDPLIAGVVGDRVVLLRSSVGRHRVAIALILLPPIQILPLANNSQIWAEHN